jgi:hypothetical protein
VDWGSAVICLERPSLGLERYAAAGAGAGIDRLAGSYFAEQGDWPPVFNFALLLLLALVSIRPFFPLSMKRAV